MDASDRKKKDSKVSNRLGRNVKLRTRRNESTEEREIEQRSILTRQHQTPSDIPNRTPARTTEPESERSGHPPGVKDTTPKRKQDGRRGIHDNLPSGRKRRNGTQTRHSRNNDDRTTRAPRVQKERSKIVDHISRRQTKYGERKQSIRPTIDQSNGQIPPCGSGIPNGRNLDKSHQSRQLHHMANNNPKHSPTTLPRIR